MKRFFGLFAALFITLLIYSCSDSTGPNSGFTPYTVGSFRITSPSEGVWIGSQVTAYKMGARAQTADSVITFDAPDGNSLKLVVGQKSSLVQYTDSNKYYDGHVLYGDELTFSNFLGADINHTYSAFPDHWSVTQGFPNPQCDSTYHYSEYLQIRIRPDSLPNRTVRINAQGVTEAVQSMLCN